MDLAAPLATIERLRARDFPARTVRSGDVLSGPGFHLTDLWISEPFFEDDGVAFLEARDDVEAYCQALIERLSAEWGPPRTLDLLPYLEARETGGHVPPPLDTLCGYVLGEVYGWQVGDRWIGLGTGQQGRDLPLQLVLGIGERDIVPGGDTQPGEFLGEGGR
jgi:hypothetical protein